MYSYVQYNTIRILNIYLQMYIAISNKNDPGAHFNFDLIFLSTVQYCYKKKIRGDVQLYPRIRLGVY